MAMQETLSKARDAVSSLWQATAPVEGHRSTLALQKEIRIKVSPQDVLSAGRALSPCRPIVELIKQMPPHAVLQSLYLHPIKSCRGSSVPEAKVTQNGLLYDRTWLIIDQQKNRFCTARELPRMVLITPHVDLERGILRIDVPLTEKGKGIVTVETPLEPRPDQLAQMELVEDVTIWIHKVDGYAVSKEADDALSEVSTVRTFESSLALTASMTASPRRAVQRLLTTVFCFPRGTCSSLAVRSGSSERAPLPDRRGLTTVVRRRPSTFKVSTTVVFAL